MNEADLEVEEKRVEDEEEEDIDLRNSTHKVHRVSMPISRESRGIYEPD